MTSQLVRFKRNISFEWALWYYTLCYNDCNDSNYAIDTAVEPLYRLVDRFAKRIGPVFVAFVTALISAVVGLFYSFILPFKISTCSSATIMFHLICGHWLLINIVYHYVRAVITPPGSPPAVIPETSSICKKCIAPKPPRTHHCSICDRCVLKMDHHCPWINNCVGHFNHRYFFLFMVYMWLGVLYVCTSSFDQFAIHAWGEEGLINIFAPVFRFLYSGERIIVAHLNASDPLATPIAGAVPVLTADGARLKMAVFFEFILCFAVLLALGALLFYHVNLVSKAETTIEKHINTKEAKRLSKLNKLYRNPYNFGLKVNWRMFLGLEQGRSFWKHILLPSGHAPLESGLQWRSIYEPGNGTKLM